MKFVQENVALILFVLVLGIVFIVRIEIENNNMNSPSVSHFIESGKSYKTMLSVKTDPRSLSYSADFVGIDKNLDRRVLARSDWETKSLAIGLKVGESIEVHGYLRELSEFQSYLKREHIVAVFIIESILKIYPNKSPVNVATQKIRDVIARGCSKLNTSEIGVCEGLLIGKRNSIDEELYDTYRKSQLTHLLVASGANIAFLVGFLKPLLSRVRRNYASLSLIIIALFYCALTRFEPSMLRASIMVIIPTLLSMRGIGISRLKVFIFTILGCSILDPYLLFRVGFWLSLCASGGLIFLSPRLTNFVKSEIVRNTISATLCVQPILWIVFGFELPFRWWASVLGVVVAETLTTFGMVVVLLSGLLGSNGVLAEIMLFPLQVGCSSLNLIATFGASRYSIPIGIVVTIYLLFRFAVKCLRSVW